MSSLINSMFDMLVRAGIDRTNKQNFLCCLDRTCGRSYGVLRDDVSNYTVNNKNLNFTILHVAVLVNNTWAVEHILNKTKDISKKCVFGYTAHDYAVMSNNYKILKLFEKYNTKKFEDDVKQNKKLKYENKSLKRKRDQLEDEIDDLKKDKKQALDQCHLYETRYKTLKNKMKK
jgi:hypothetical protein